MNESGYVIYSTGSIYCLKKMTSTGLVQYNQWNINRYMESENNVKMICVDLTVLKCTVYLLWLHLLSVFSMWPL